MNFKKYLTVSMVLILLSGLVGCSNDGATTETKSHDTDTESDKISENTVTEVVTNSEADMEVTISESPFENFEAVIRFTVGSDLQYGEGTGRTGLTREDYAKRFEDFIDLSYTLYAEDESYEGADLIAMVGDLTVTGAKDQYEECIAVTDEHIKDGTEFLITMGNHEFYSGMSVTECVELFNQYYGEENRVVVIENYYFIGVSSTQEGFSSETLIWMNKMLQEAVATDESGTRPIFVFTHQNPYDTVLGSQKDRWGWGTPTLGDLLKKYPNVVLFTGHSHFAIEDPASFWQGEYSVFIASQQNPAT